MSNSGQKNSPKSQDWLPTGWIMEIKERPTGTMKDKYYIEPNNGRKFRSKKEVFRFLETGKSGRKKDKVTKPDNNGVEDVGSGEMRMIAGNVTRDRQLPVEKNGGGSSLGWQVKFVQRENGATQKYFVDPVNGYKFYSEKEIVHYLQTKEVPVPKKIEDSTAVQREVVAEEVATPKRRGKSNVVQGSKDRSLGRLLDWLPVGWKVRCCERKNGMMADKYYIDPVSGYKFRSRKDVSRYLENGVFPARAGKKRKFNDAGLSDQGISLSSSVVKKQKLACRSTMKGLFPEKNDLENNESATMEKEKQSEVRASDQLMEGLECHDKNVQPKSKGNYMVDDFTLALPVSVFSPQQYAMENSAAKHGKGKSKRGRKKSESKKEPENRKPRPDPIKSRNRKEPTLPCRSSTRLAEMKPRDVKNDVPEVTAEVETVKIEEEVNKVGKMPVGESDQFVEESVPNNVESYNTVNIEEEVNDVGKMPVGESELRMEENVSSKFESNIAVNIEEEVNEVGKMPVGESDRFVEENISNKFESNNTVTIEEEVNKAGKMPVGESELCVEENVSNKFESNSTESVIAMLFGESSSSSFDPCLEFAYKTLAGIIPMENLPVNDSGSVET